MTQFIDGLGQVLDRYDGLVVDLWGVMHNGQALFPEAVAALQAAKDADMTQGLDHIEFVEDLSQAGWILNVGPEQGNDDVAPFQPWIEVVLAHDLPMICANPDLVVQRGTQMEICAGAVARAYADQGGNVVWYGKPHGAVYDEVFKSAGMGADRLLAIGDSFKTDVRGALAQGMDVLYVNTGIHGRDIGQPLDRSAFDRVAREHEAWPTFAAERLEV